MCKDAKLSCRGNSHSCREAERILGYIAPVPYREAMDLTASWLLFARLI